MNCSAIASSEPATIAPQEMRGKACAEAEAIVRSRRMSLMLCCVPLRWPRVSFATLGNFALHLKQRRLRGRIYSWWIRYPS